LWYCHHDKVIARVDIVHLMNVEQCQAAASPQTKSNDLAVNLPVGSCCLHSSSSVDITHPGNWCLFYHAI